jgi:hypothetical protein
MLYAPTKTAKPKMMNVRFSFFSMNGNRFMKQTNKYRSRVSEHADKGANVEGEAARPVEKAARELGRDDQRLALNEQHDHREQENVRHGLTRVQEAHVGLVERGVPEYVYRKQVEHDAHGQHRQRKVVVHRPSKTVVVGLHFFLNTKFALLNDEK